LGKLQNTVRNADDCQANKSVTFKSLPGTGPAAQRVIKRKWLSYPKTKYSGTDNTNVKTVMGSASPEELGAD